MDEGISIEKLSAWTGEPEERLREWRSLGLIGREGEGELGAVDYERARLVQMLLRRGISLETISWAEKEGLVERVIERMFPSGAGPSYSLAEAAELVGLEPGLMRRVWRTLAGEGEPIRERDIEGLKLFKTYLDLGFPEDALMQGTRVYVDSMARIAEAESRLFHFYVHERLRAGGLSGDALIAASDAAGDEATRLIEPALLFFHSREWERAQKEDLALHLAEAAGLMEKGDVPGQLEQAVAFVDLSSFTPLTEAMGDEKAAEVVDRFSALVRESAGRWDGRVVKQIGDAFMLAFSDARSAVACTLEIESRTAEEPQFPAARSGLHWGKVLYREGDYVGSNVNIASRVAGEAQRHQVVVTDAVRRTAKGLSGVEFVRLGKRRVKGLPNHLVLFEARMSGTEAREKAVDPVCGMEMGADEVAARLTLEGEEKAFCSDECLRRYVQAPARYGG